MSDLNVVVLKGRLTRDPEHRHTPSGNQVCNGGIAIDGFKEGDTSFFEWVAWGKQADFINAYFKKGKEICIQGRLKQETWNDRHDGSKRSKVVVVVNDAFFCGPKDADSQPQHSARSNSAPSSEPEENDDDLPF